MDVQDQQWQFLTDANVLYFLMVGGKLSNIVVSWLATDWICGTGGATMLYQN